MENKKGFVATSLIYSFFLVFVALLALLLRSYVSNKTILNRYNDSVAQKLNSNNYKLSVYLQNSEVVGGIFLNNLIHNGNFNGTEHWTFNPPSAYSISALNTETFSGFSAVKSNSSNTAYVKQENIQLVAGRKYYYEVSGYSTVNLSSTMEIGITQHGSSTVRNVASQKCDATHQINCSNNSGTLSKFSSFDSIYGIFTVPTTNTYDFVAGKTSSSSSGSIYVTNIRIIDLTNQYGNGSEPQPSWVHNNVSWFDNSASYYFKNYVSYNKDLEFIVSGSEVNINKIKCRYIKNYNKTVKVHHENSTETNKYVFKIDEVEGDIECNDY